jgi:hypothetical protein
VPRRREVFTPLKRDVLEYPEAMTNTPPTVASFSVPDASVVRTECAERGPDLSVDRVGPL